jgi:hypothetical protein
MVELPDPPTLRDVRKDVKQRLRALRTAGAWDAEPKCFQRRFGLVVIDRTAANQLADAEYQRRLRVYELIRTNWNRLMLCLRCGHIYDPYIHDELIAEGRRLYEAGERRTGSRHYDELLNDFAERVSNLERRAARGEEPEVGPVGQSLKATFGPEFGRALLDGQVSPVAQTRLIVIANRAQLVLFDWGAKQYRTWSATVACAVAEADLDDNARGPLLLRIEAANAEVAYAVEKAHEAMRSIGLIQQIDIDPNAFDRPSRLLEQVILVGPVAAIYRQSIARNAAPSLWH